MEGFTESKKQAAQGLISVTRTQSSAQFHFKLEPLSDSPHSAWNINMLCHGRKTNVCI